MFSSPPAQTLFHGFQIFSRARRAPPRKLKGASNSRVAIPLAKCLVFQALRSGIATASGDTFIAKKEFMTRLWPARDLFVAALRTSCDLPAGIRRRQRSRRGCVKSPL